jgi:hypothetical protein
MTVQREAGANSFLFGATAAASNQSRKEGDSSEVARHCPLRIGGGRLARGRGTAEATAWVWMPARATREERVRSGRSCAGPD